MIIHFLCFYVWNLSERKAKKKIEKLFMIWYEKIKYITIH